MSKHMMVDGQLIQMDKSYSQLKQKQKDRIVGWMYEAFRRQTEADLSDEEALSLIETKNRVASRLDFSTPEEVREWAVSVDPGPQGLYSAQGCFNDWGVGNGGSLVSWRIDDKIDLRSV